MDDPMTAAPAPAGGANGHAGRSRLKSFWVRVRGPLAQSRIAKRLLVSLMSAGLLVVRWTNRRLPETTDLFGEYREYEPGIIALWHGQHLVTPAFYPSPRKLVAMVSRSADAELNAQVLQRFGIDVVRGSGGREGAQPHEKGGARALIALKKALEKGNNVCMIADIPHGTPRDAGMGIILLARLSGRPIAPSAIVTSRRVVLEKSWDKTTICLPFGRFCSIREGMIHVPPDADEAEMERKRQELTLALNRATARAYAAVDRPS